MIYNHPFFFSIKIKNLTSMFSKNCANGLLYMKICLQLLACCDRWYRDHIIWWQMFTVMNTVILSIMLLRPLLFSTHHYILSSFSAKNFNSFPSVSLGCLQKSFCHFSSVSFFDNTIIFYLQQVQRNRISSNFP